MKRICLISLVTVLLVSLISMSCGATPHAAAWTKTFDSGSEDDYGNSVRQTSDGGYIIAGYTGFLGATGEDMWLIKADSSGNLAWNKTFGGSGWEEANSVQQTSDGGYIIVGVAGDTCPDVACYYDVWLIKVTV